jgi:hypothetical protein
VVAPPWITAPPPGYTGIEAMIATLTDEISTTLLHHPPGLASRRFVSLLRVGVAGGSGWVYVWSYRGI